MFIADGLKIVDDISSYQLKYQPENFSERDIKVLSDKIGFNGSSRQAIKAKMKGDPISIFKTSRINSYLDISFTKMEDYYYITQFKIYLLNDFGNRVTLDSRSRLECVDSMIVYYVADSYESWIEFIKNIKNIHDDLLERFLKYNILNI